MHAHRETRSLILGLMIAILAVCCLPCQASSQVVPPPVRTVEVSAEASQALVFKLREGLVLEPEGLLVLIVTEEELTSYVALNMQRSITEPQVILTDGKLYLYGTLVSPIEAPVAAMCIPEVQDGRVQIEVQAVALAGFPIPETFVQAFARQIDDLIVSAQRLGEVQITEIDITEGEVIVRGRAQLAPG